MRSRWSAVSYTAVESDAEQGACATIHSEIEGWETVPIRDTVIGAAMNSPSGPSGAYGEIGW